MGMVLASTGAGLWVLHDCGLLTLRDTSQVIWIALMAVSLVLGIGLSRRHIRRRPSGQSDMDDAGE